MADTNLPPLPYSSPLVGPDGKVSVAWSKWLQQLFYRVGGNIAKTNKQLDLASGLGTVTTAMIEDGAITNPKVGPQAITTTKVADLNITTQKLAAGAADNTKLANMVNSTIKGRVTAGTGSPEDLTAAQVTAMLGVFTDLLQGLVPASGGGTTNYLRADGAWQPAVPADGTITTAKLADGTVTNSKMSGSGATSGQMLRYVGTGVVWVDPPISAANGGQLITDGAGDNEINISPTPAAFVLADSGAVLWDVKVNNDGSIYTSSGSAGTATTAFKIQKPDLSYASIGIGTDGTLFVDSAPTATQVNNLLFLQSPDSHLWQLAIDNSNDIQTIEDAGNGARLSVVDSTGDVLWQVRSLPGYAVLQYARIISASDVATATPPPTVVGCLPYAFYDNGSVKRLIFYDGSAWRYVHDNSAV